MDGFQSACNFPTEVLQFTVWMRCCNLLFGCVLDSPWRPNCFLMIENWPARDPPHAALASFRTRGGGSDGTKAGSILIREGVATKSGQPEPQLDQGRAQNEPKGAAKHKKRAAIFREEIINIPNRVSKQGGRAGRCPGPAGEVVAHLEVSRFASSGEQFAEPADIQMTDGNRR